jgi:putative tricarboxylic transport membrane protein
MPKLLFDCLRGACGACGAVAVLKLVAVPAFSAEPVWKPVKPVELVAINAPGGGSDRILRLMVKVFQEQRAMDVPVNVVNKPGGGGAMAYSYIAQQADGHTLVLANKSMLTNNIVGRGQSYTEFTAVVNLFAEYISVTVKYDSPIKGGADLIDRLKKDVNALTLGIATSIGNPNHQGLANALSLAGIDIKKTRNVIFPSGGAATTALMGGHVDVAPVTAAFAASLVRNNQVRVVAVAAPRRLGGVLAGVPTWREQGFDAVVSNWRVFLGTKAMPATQIAYWERVFRRLTESEEWKKELDENFWLNDFLPGAEARKQLDRDDVQLRAFLKELALTK